MLLLLYIRSERERETERERKIRERAGEERSWIAVEGLEILGRGVSVLTPVENYFICFWKST